MAVRTITIPAGFEPDGVGAPLLTMSIRLVTLDRLKPVLAYHGALVVGSSLIRVAGEAVSFELPVNADLTPVGDYATVDVGGEPLTRWQIRMTADGVIFPASFVVVPAGETEITLPELLA